MSNFLDLLLGSLSGGGGSGASPPLAAAANGSTAPPIASSAPTATPVGGLDVVAPRTPSIVQKPMPTSLNYNNSNDAQAVHSAVTADAPQGGSDNPGIYGLLPKNLQHGTLRNVLGALGDAFLVGHGDAATYGPRMARQAEGSAMAGYDQDPQAAIQRVAATGAPGAMQDADRLQTSYENLQARKAMLEYNNQYKAGMQQDRESAQVNRIAPLAGGLVQGITDPTKYAAAYSRADAMAKRINPQFDASSAFGLPTPEEWTPDATTHAGMTGNNVTQTNDRAASRAQSGRDTDVRAGATLQAAGINAGRPSTALTIQQLKDKQNAGQPLSPAEQSLWAKYTTVNSRRTSLPAGLTPGGGGGGTGPVVTNADVSYVKQNPNMKAAFIAHFGQAAYDKYVGK